MTLFSIKLYSFGGKKGLRFTNLLLILKITAFTVLAHSAYSIIGVIGKVYKA